MIKCMMMLLFAVCNLVGSERNPFDVYRIGDRLDAVRLEESTNCGKPWSVNLQAVDYSYWEYKFNVAGVACSVQVSEEGGILGVKIAQRCCREDIADCVESFKKQLVALYRDKLESCGAPKSEIEISINSDNTAGLVEVACRKTTFADLAKKNEQLEGGVLSFQ